MKIRSGFVSNSSSSSFLVAFPALPKTREELREILFEPGQAAYPCPWDFLEVKEYPLDQVVETVWNDLQSQQPIDPKEAVELLAHGTVDGIHRAGPNCSYLDGSHQTGICYDDFRDPQTNKIDWPVYHRRVEKLAAEVYAKFLQDHPGVVVVKFHYSDNDSDYFSCLEHGSLFDRLPHIVISHH